MSKKIEVFCWMGEIHQSDISKCKEQLEFLRSNSISGIIYRGDREEFKEVASIAKGLGLYVEAWYPALICVNKDESIIDPSLFAVSKDLVPANLEPPYVDYYKWLCPNNPGTIKLLSKDIDRLISIKDLDSIHLDYIRYCDIFLPVGLWSKYNLVMDRVINQFDFCYCDICRGKFKAEYGIDPISINPESIEYIKWSKFRLNSVSSLVQNLRDQVKSRGKSISAAVFPGPSIAKKNVLQEWNKWNLDRYYPMNYNTFYNKTGKWVGDMVCEEVSSTNGEIYSGIYLYDLPLEDFEIALKSSIASGAKGISLFVPEDMSNKHWAILKKIITFK